MNIFKNEAAAQADFPLGILTVRYPDSDRWQVEPFHAMVEAHLAALRERFRDYDRKTVFGENPYNRYFKRYKKTYPVLQQFESFLLKDRPFPKYNPITEIPFLAELETHALMGSHDADRVSGDVEVFLADGKLPFPGMRGEEVHTYPGDLSARDDQGIILGQIAGADQRTYVRPDSRRIFHPVFGVPGLDSQALTPLLDRLEEYPKVVCPQAQV